MLELIRYKLAARLAEKAHRLIDTGGYKNIKKGLRYFKWSVMVVPPSDELREIGEGLRKIVEEKRKSIFKED